MAENRRLLAGIGNRPRRSIRSQISSRRYRASPQPCWGRANRVSVKTTIWLAASDQARDLGFRVLTTRTAEVESGFAYASLADLLRGVDDALVNALPGPQQMAVDRILLRTGGTAFLNASVPYRLA